MMTRMSDGNGSKTLYRTYDGRIIAGVCSGMGEYFGVDANVIRVILFVLTLFTGVVPGILVYLGAWVVIPEVGEKTSIAENLLNKTKKT
jgi:phage shock protein PspC (stress-responsive transcriptional regulator)